MASLVTCLACFAALIGISSCSYQNMFKDIYNGQKSERELRHHIFQNYDKLVRPVKDANDQISVALSITPLYLRDLDEKNQVMVLESWILMKWTDQYLTWEPSRFSNLSVLRIPATEVWRPDFSVYTSPDENSMFPVPLTNILIYNSGQVLWVPPITVRSRCPMLKASKKIITCNIKIGSWTYDGNILDIQLATEKVDLTNFLDINPNWKLMGVSADRVSKYYPCCKEPYPSVNFNVTLKRRNEHTTTPSTEENVQEMVLTDFTDINKLLGL